MNMQAEKDEWKLAVSLTAEICIQTCISCITHEMLTALHCLLLFIFKLVYCWFMLNNILYIQKSLF